EGPAPEDAASPADDSAGLPADPTDVASGVPTDPARVAATEPPQTGDRASQPSLYVSAEPRDPETGSLYTTGPVEPVTAGVASARSVEPEPEPEVLPEPEAEPVDA